MDLLGSNPFPPTVSVPSVAGLCEESKIYALKEAVRLITGYGPFGSVVLPVWSPFVVAYVTDNLQKAGYTIKNTPNGLIVSWA